MQVNRRAKRGNDETANPADRTPLRTPPPSAANGPARTRARLRSATPSEKPLITAAQADWNRRHDLGPASSSPDQSGVPESDQPSQHPALISAAAQKELAVKQAAVDAWAGPDLELHPWEQQPNESDADFACFLTYLNMGPSRTVRQAAIDHYYDQNAGANQSRADAPPQSWTAKSSRWGWIDRADRWDVWIAERDLETTRARMKDDRENRYVKREKARGKLYELIEAMDPNLVELRPGDLFRAVAILNDDARTDLDRVVEKADATRAKTPADLIGGAMSFAQLVELAARAKAETEMAPARKSAKLANLDDDAESEPIDAEYTRVG